MNTSIAGKSTKNGAVFAVLWNNSLGGIFGFAGGKSGAVFFDRTECCQGGDCVTVVGIDEI